MKWVTVLLGCSLTACGYVGFEADDKLERDLDNGNSGASSSLGLGGDDAVHTGASGPDERVGSGGASSAGGQNGAGGNVAASGGAGSGGVDATGGSIGDTGGSANGTGGAEPRDVPRASEFVETFDETDRLALAWITNIRGVGCKLGVSEGRLQFVMAAGEVGRCEVTSKARSDLRNDALAIHLPGISKFYPEMKVFFAILGENDGDRIELSYQNKQFQVSAWLGGENKFSDSATYSTDLNFWRIREEAAVVFIEASVDGVSWEGVSRLEPTPFTVGAVLVNLGVEVASEMDGDVSVSILGVNTFSE